MPHLKTKTGPQEITPQQIRDLLDNGIIQPKSKLVSIDGGKTWMSSDEFFRQSSPKAPSIVSPKMRRIGIVGGIVIALICSFFLLLPVSANISGAVWAIRSGGTSDVLRGLKVYVLKPEMDKSDALKILNHAIESESPSITNHLNSRISMCKESADSWKKMADQYRQMANEAGEATGKLYEDYVKKAEEYDDDYKKELAIASEETKVLNEFPTATADQVRIWKESSKSMDGDPLGLELLEIERVVKWKDAKQALPPMVDLDGLFDLVGYYFVFPDSLVIYQSQTNVDGKYVIKNVGGGKYYLAAICVSETSSMEWLIPINISHSGDIPMDLYNDNAKSIHNFSR